MHTMGVLQRPWENRCLAIAVTVALFMAGPGVDLTLFVLQQ
jgi:hypothetical protein